MDEKSLFTKFWVKESTTTRTCSLEFLKGQTTVRIPSRAEAHEIGWWIVCEERMIIEALETGKGEWAPPPMPPTMKEVLEAYDKQSEGITQRWQTLRGERWDGTLEFFGRQRPASPMAWSFNFDIVHHRGQISTYLRPMGSTVPQIYGPSADER
jgi:uncharacterized damage-inducible protein DinB